MSTDAEPTPTSELESQIARCKVRNDKIVAAACSGESLSEIAKRHDLTRERVRQIASDGGYSRRDYLQDRDSKICKALQNGADLNEIAIDFSLATASIRLIARKYGLSLKRPGGLHLGTLEIIARLLKGDSYKEIAGDAHVLPQVIIQRASNYRAAGIPIPYHLRRIDASLPCVGQKKDEANGQ